MSDTILETQRLILRQWRDSDLEPMAAINQDPQVMEHFPAPKTFEETRNFIAGNKALYEQVGYFLYAVELKDNHDLIGWVGLQPVGEEMPCAPAVEIGWRIGTKYWRQGYATEAAQAVVEHAFNILGLNELVSFTTTTNKRSEKLMQRLGFTRSESEDFDHPKIVKGHKLKRHVFYRKHKLCDKTKNVKLKSININLKLLTEEDLPLLHDWFQKSHIKQWYARGEYYSLEKIKGKYIPRILNPESIPNFIVYVDKQPIGYIQLYRVSSSLPDGIEDYTHSLFTNYKPEEIAGIDMFIADEKYLGKGFASLALNTFIKEHVNGKYLALITDPLKSNNNAIRFFERNNFKKIIDNKNTSINELMILKMENQCKIILEIQDNELTKKGNAAIIDFYQTMSIDQFQLPGIFAAVTEMNNPFLNVVIDTRENRNNSFTQIDACQQFFAKHNIPWAWFVTPGSENNDLTQHGFSLLEEAPAMYFDLHTPIPNLKCDSIIIQEASATDDLQTWIEPINEGFGAKPGDDSYRKLNAKLLNNSCEKLRHFVGYHDGNIVSSGTLFVSHGSVMLHNLATKTAYTKRGFGTAFTLHMMQRAKEMGIQHFFLDSSADGVSIYKKIGFKVYSTTIIYSQEQTKL